MWEEGYFGIIVGKYDYFEEKKDQILFVKKNSVVITLLLWWFQYEIRLKYLKMKLRKIKQTNLFLCL